jgi:hypothetical protein
VAHVDDQADPVHLGDDLATHAGDAGVLGLVAAGRQQGLVVVAELHEARAQGVADPDQPDIVFDWRGVLEAEEDRRAPGLAGQADIRAGAALEDQVREALEPAVPLFYVQDGLAEVLVIGYGHMDRVHAALAHLAEDRLRPVGVLQVVDAVGAGHVGWPEAIHCPFSGLKPPLSRRSSIFELHAEQAQLEKGSFKRPFLKPAGFSRY